MAYRPSRSAVRKVLTLPSLARELRARAERGARAAGDGYIAVSEIGRNRARAAVVAASPHARNDNAKNHTLLRIIDDMRH